MSNSVQLSHREKGTPASTFSMYGIAGHCSDIKTRILHMATGVCSFSGLLLHPSAARLISFALLLSAPDTEILKQFHLRTSAHSLKWLKNAKSFYLCMLCLLTCITLEMTTEILLNTLMHFKITIKLVHSTLTQIFLWMLSIFSKAKII